MRQTPVTVRKTLRTLSRETLSRRTGTEMTKTRAEADWKMEVLAAMLEKQMQRINVLVPLIQQITHTLF